MSDVQTRRDAIERSIYGRMLACSLDELRVVDYLLAGLERGRDVYGYLDLATDCRDFADEERQEVRDGLVYRACRELLELDAARSDVRDQAARELAQPYEGGEG